MTVWANQKGSQTAVISTEHTLQQNSGANSFQFTIDCTNMVNGDITEVRQYRIVNSSAIVEACDIYANVQAIPLKRMVITASQGVTNGIKITVKQTAGTGRVFDWELLADSSNPGLTAAQIATGVWQDATAGDFTTASSIGKSLYTSGVVPGGSGGIVISGSNSGTTTFAALTVTGTTTMSDGLAISRSSSNVAGLTISGNGSGNGITVTPGITGAGISIAGGATSGRGIDISTTSGIGISVAATLGEGIKATSTSTNAISGLGGSAGAGFFGQGGSSGAGMKAQGGTNGIGFSIQGGGTTGDAVSIGSTSGNGITIAPTAGHGISVAANGTSKHGMTVTGGTAGTSDGIKAVAGTGGVDIRGNITGNITGTLDTVTNLTNAPTAGDFTATMKTSLNSATPVATLSSAYDFAKGTVAMTESYAAQGATITPAQALYMINQFLGQHSTASTIWTVKKRDGSTTAKTYTLDSATAPTSITEAT